MIRKLVAAVAIAALPFATTVVERATKPIYKAVMVNCEDYDIQPCITADDSKWVRVDSYSPYKAKRTKKCTTRTKVNCFRIRKDGKFNYYFRSL